MPSQQANSAQSAHSRSMVVAQLVHSQRCTSGAQSWHSLSIVGTRECTVRKPSMGVQSVRSQCTVSAQSVNSHLTVNS